MVGFSIGIRWFSGTVSGQITIIPKPELRGFGGNSLTKPPFGVTNRRFGRCNLPRLYEAFFWGGGP